jgi:hypothetical protein
VEEVKLEEVKDKVGYGLLWRHVVVLVVVGYYFVFVSD